MGSAIHILVATMGLRVIIKLSSSVFPWLQMAGGFYILYLAIETFRSNRESSEEVTNQRDARGVFLSGLFACVTNPKAIIFFVSLFPGFIDVNHNIAVQSIVYGALFIILDASFICGYSLLAVYVLRSETFSMLRFEVISGVGLGLIGCLLIVKGAFEGFSSVM